MPETQIPNSVWSAIGYYFGQQIHLFQQNFTLRGNDPVEFYKTLLNDQDMFDDFRRASRHLNNESFHNVVKVNGVYAEVYIKSVLGMPRYMLPANDFRPGVDWKYATEFITALAVIRDWSTARHTFNWATNCKKFDAHVIGFLFPWLARIPDHVWNETTTGTKLNKLEIIQRDNYIHTLRHPRPRYIPTLTPRVNAACQLSGKLIAQAHLLNSVPAVLNVGWYAVPDLAHMVQDSALMTELADVEKQWVEDNERRFFNQRIKKLK